MNSVMMFLRAGLDVRDRDDHAKSAEYWPRGRPAEPTAAPRAIVSDG